MPQLDLVRTAVAGWQAGRQADCLAGWLVDSCSVQFSSIGAEDMFPQPSPNKPPSRPHPQPHPQRWPWSLIWASVDCAWLLQRQGRSILPLRSGPDPWMPRGGRCTRSTRPSGHRCSPLDTTRCAVARTCGWPTRVPVALPAPTPLAEARRHMTWMGKASPGRVLIL